MTIKHESHRRGISRILHFTTNYGLLGILATRHVRPRQRLTSDQYIERIYKPNCAERPRDAPYHDYVNLSITQINSRLFGIASGSWHRDIDGWWCILSFDPAILTHDGVLFTTTNNMYTGVRRGPGKRGLEAMFADRVVQWQGKVVQRSADHPMNQPTCFQAEVLYPGDLPLHFVQRIYVREAEHLDAVAAMFAALSVEVIPTIVERDLFVGGSA